ncbi:hypothetical protein EDB81DRAFT_774023 [Dactylonectria macrodidyma]|uniref:Transmembrane protein n=1 Tax=Dactylonectria macrodidyma TaxID=307937 RepID=A0A9P9FM73_9HYPO|nr:hypothetical protein EDB81DRAFT_774023 [Dactylonectria macrodidyma]
MNNKYWSFPRPLLQLSASFLLPFGFAFPIPQASEPSFQLSVDTGQDAWAESLSGVGPLILLIGEKNTKQLLREANGLPAILSMSFAPIGLLSVLTSMIRLCGSPRLRSYLGYEHEPRANAALEMTKANCAGIHAEVIDGTVSRSTTSEATSQALAVLFLRGSSEVTIEESLRQIRFCHAFQDEKTVKGCPEAAGNVNWCFRVTCPLPQPESINAISRLVANSLKIDEQSDLGEFLRVFQRTATATDPKSRVSYCQHKSATQDGNPVHSEKHSVSSQQQVYDNMSAELEETNPTTPSMTKRKGAAEESVATSLPPQESTAHLSAQITTAADLPLKICTTDLQPPKPIKSSFFCTFDGVSEVNTSAQTSAGISLTVATISFLSMVAIQIIALWQEGWFSNGIIMVFVGYFCMVIGVSGAGYMIYSACDSAAMQALPKTADADWTHGVVLLVKNTDSLDTTGSLLMQSENQKQEFQAVWVKKQGGVRFVLTWAISIFLALAFVCYYLGLRSSKWWLSVTQLLVCLASAFARSVGKMDRGSFDAVEDIRVDKRCYSTGILDMQRATRITEQQRTSKTLDLRIYSTLSSHCLALTGELVAWRAAKLCLEPQYQATGDRILSVTGMSLGLVQATDERERHVLVEFEGGIVTEEGLAFPNVTVATAFSSSNADLAAPTPLLARGIMRQSQWSLEKVQINKGSLPFMGGTYISSFDSLVTWWTIAEDRNELGDQHKNLHGSFILLCTAFFLAVLRKGEKERDLVKTINAAHEQASQEDDKYAQALMNFLTIYLD